ncbi:MAG: hypothetical protein CGW95_06380 [Phenylobacterium zucineum]|nr:MAG: hypothetical protein CGW95_06380 [Phenylobacterium zucineum]
MRTLTLDGHLLNCLYLTDGLKVGQSLVPAVSKDQPIPVYRKAMSVTEQVEFVTDSLTAMGFASADASGLSRAVVSGKTGVRFDIKAVNPDGLQISGMAQVLESDDRLYVAVFLAPTEHYFKEGQSEAARILASLKL